MIKFYQGKPSPALIAWCKERYGSRPLCFQENTPGNGATVSLNGYINYSKQSQVMVHLEYSTDDCSTWTEYTNQVIELDQCVDNKVFFRAPADNPNVDGLCDAGRSGLGYFHIFYFSKPVKAAGSIQYLLSYDGSRTDVPAYAYQLLFQRQSNLITAPELPATTLADYCYAGLFDSCSSLHTAPELPATQMAYGCYSSMFCGSGLTVPPVLPAMKLAQRCYYQMFAGCRNMPTAPVLPAIEMEPYCYNSMFYQAYGLVNGPELPATTLEDYCYSDMFSEVDGLKYIKVHFTEWHKNATRGWVKAIYGNGIFECPDALTQETGYDRIPMNFTVNTFNKDPLNLANATMAGLSSQYIYAETEIIPEVSVYSLSGDLLTENVQWSKQLSNNINVGTAGISAIGISPYYGCLQNTFKIINEYQSYTELLYLTMSGKQHIDTGIVPTDVETKIKFNMTEFDLVGGLLQHADAGYYQVCYYQGDFCIGTDGTEYRTETFRLNVVHDITYNQIGTHDFIVDGIVYKSGITNITSQNNSPLLIGGYRPNVSYNNGATIVFYGATLTNRSDGTILRDFIPVKDNANVVCLYDKVSKTYFYNQGTGEFIAGPNAKDSKDLSNATMTGLSSWYLPTGSEIIPEVSVYSRNGTLLTENVQWSKQLSNNINIGTAEISAIGISPYYGCLQQTFEIVSERPSYTELEYIESSGTQWIGTNVKCTSNSDIIENHIKFLLPKTVDASKTIFGNYSNNSRSGGIWALTAGTLYTTAGSTNYLPKAVTTYTIYDWLNKIDGTTSTVYQTINDELKTTTYSGSLVCSEQIGLFARGNGTERPSSLRVYSFSSIINSVKLIDLIPVKDNNGVVCMYDKVSKTYFYNQGTGEFIAGPEK